MTNPAHLSPDTHQRLGSAAISPQRSRDRTQCITESDTCSSNLYIDIHLILCIRFLLQEINVQIECPKHLPEGGERRVSTSYWSVVRQWKDTNEDPACTLDEWWATRRMDLIVNPRQISAVKTCAIQSPPSWWPLTHLPVVWVENAQPTADQWPLFGYQSIASGVRRG